jgi:succinate-acetate transporter protein
VFTGTEDCPVEDSQPEFSFEELLAQTRCDMTETTPYCKFWDSFLSVYTMLLGEVDETQFKNSDVGTALFVIFMFLVVILLANVLIAIVTDSYKVIQVSVRRFRY